MIRTALADAATAPAAGGARRRIDVDVELRADGAAAGGRLAIGNEILGAGDIVAIERSAIARIEPQAGLRGFEPQYLPFVEFVDSDFPWRHSLDVGQTRVLPWIVLLALQPDEFEFLGPNTAQLERIRVFDVARSLPDLSQSWAFAHAQVHRGADGAALDDVLENDPTAQFSRLLCPRKLEAQAVYHLFVVPTFEAGRLAGLGNGSAPSAWNALAWTAAAGGDVELPTYVQSQLATSTIEDIEQLARRLQPYKITAAAAVGESVRASARRPGYYADYERPGATFAIQTALRRPGAETGPVETDVALQDRLAATLGDVIAGESVAADADGPDREDPLIAMPPYGWRFGPYDRPSPPRAAQSRWFDRVNLDLKFRQAAGLGAEMVRRRQDELIRICWSQYAEIVEANRQLGLLGVAEAVVSRVAEKRLSRLPTEVVVTLSEPTLAFVRLPDGSSVRETLARKGVPRASTSRALRRLASKRTFAEGVSRHRIAMPRLPGTDVAVGGRARGIRRRGDAPPPPPHEVDLGELDAIVPLAELQQQRLAPAVRVAVGAYQPQLLSAAVVQLALALPSAKAMALVDGLRPAETAAITPIYRAPRVAVPLANILIDEVPGSVLRAADQLPANSVTLVEENRAFVEAFLVGANHEINNELRWREFPTDMRGTVLPRFWDRRRPVDDITGDDIGPIHAWRRTLGRNFPPHDVDAQANLVLIVRGDIVRKLGDPVVVLNHASGTRWVRGDGTDHETILFGSLGPDIAYYGFDVGRAAVIAEPERYFVVIYEPVGKLRFGLDVATVALRRAHNNVSRAPLPFPIRTLPRATRQVMPVLAPAAAQPVAGSPATWDHFSWQHVRLDASGHIDVDSTEVTVGTGADHWSEARSSASIARSLWQRPVAIVIPAKRLL